MINQVQNWLRDKKRKYADGVALFEKFENDELKKRYLPFFKAVEDAASFDIHHTILIQKLTVIEFKMKLSPDSFKKEKVEPSKLSSEEEVSIDVAISKVDVSTLTEDKKAIYSRIQEIVPLMASIHAELDDDMLTDDERKDLAVQLTDLSDEKKSLWAEFDAKETTETAPGEVEETKDSDIQLGYLQNRLNRVNENIKRTNLSIDKAVTAGKKNLETNARSRLAMYEKDKANIEQEIAVLNEPK